MGYVVIMFMILVYCRCMIYIMVLRKFIYIIYRLFLSRNYLEKRKIIEARKEEFGIVNVCMSFRCNYWFDYMN